jgi:hypothetical protein
MCHGLVLDRLDRPESLAKRRCLGQDERRDRGGEPAWGCGVTQVDWSVVLGEAIAERIGRAAEHIGDHCAEADLRVALSIGDLVEQPLASGAFATAQRFLDIANPRDVHFVVSTDAGQPRDVAQPTPVLPAETVGEVRLEGSEPGADAAQGDAEIVERGSVVRIVEPVARSHGRCQQRESDPSTPFIHRERE